MSIFFFPRKIGLIVSAALIAISVVGEASANVTVAPEAKELIKVGMTAEQVKTAIGRPAMDTAFKLSGQRIWTYAVPGGQEYLEVSFAADQTVKGVRVAVSNLH